MATFASWNVNGLRSILRKNFMDVFTELDADVFGIQEIKCQEGQVDLDLPGYYQTYSYAEKKGYSGTALFSKEKPLNILCSTGLEISDKEGRICAAEFEKYWFVSVYSPNSQAELQRLGVREEWDAHLRKTCAELSSQKPLILCGDLNVAHNPIDLARPEDNEGAAGFTNIEREDLTKFLQSGFIDTFRYLHPDQTDIYSWWSYRERGRRHNIGWRLDYFLVSDSLKADIEKADILDSVMGSDHCPITLELNL